MVYLTHVSNFRSTLSSLSKLRGGSEGMSLLQLHQPNPLPDPSFFSAPRGFEWVDQGWKRCPCDMGSPLGQAPNDQGSSPSRSWMDVCVQGHMSVPVCLDSAPFCSGSFSCVEWVSQHPVFVLGCSVRCGPCLRHKRKCTFEHTHTCRFAFTENVKKSNRNEVCPPLFRLESATVIDCACMGKLNQASRLPPLSLVVHAANSRKRGEVSNRINVEYLRHVLLFFCVYRMLRVICRIWMPHTVRQMPCLRNRQVNRPSSYLLVYFSKSFMSRRRCVGRYCH
ncbi:unnamed protein product [Periconia digitata]|uniref:Uncharacterized protein n=1 Tax=Periconia digitata TaxID=1303443 RepID=A0A9W4USJ9_9PLEO|nr:unnamed protein product [Periconia digitata]